MSVFDIFMLLVNCSSSISINQTPYFGAIRLCLYDTHCRRPETGECIAPPWRSQNAKPPDGLAVGGFGSVTWRGHVTLEARLRLRKRGLDLAEGGVELAAEQGQRAHQDHGDQGGNQAILDGGGAGLVLHEARNKLGHSLSPFVRAVRGWASSFPPARPQCISKFAGLA